MRVMNCSKKPMLVKINGRKSIIVSGGTGGQTEQVFPAKTITLPVREPIELKDEDGVVVTTRWKNAGVVEVLSGTPLEVALLAGLRKRHETLLNRIQAYRDHVAQCRQVGSMPRLPSPLEREQYDEAEAIYEEVKALDPVLAKQLPPLVQEQQGTDPIAREFERYGLEPTPPVVAPADDLNLGL